MKLVDADALLQLLIACGKSQRAVDALTDKLRREEGRKVG